eukprot:gene3677-4194_t
MSVKDKMKDLSGKVTGKATALWAKNKYYVIAGLAGFVILIILICCCWCKIRKMRKKKKKKMEKLKLKSAKPGKKLKRIQPSRNEIKVMEELGSLKFLLQYDSVSEVLLTRIIEAEDLPVRDLSGYAYSYVSAKCLPLHQHEKVEYKTKLVRAGFWPSYNDTIKFKLNRDDLAHQQLFLYVCEMNRWTKQEGIGQVIVPLHNWKLDIGEEPILKRKLKTYNPLIGLAVETGSVKLLVEYDSEEWNLQVNVLEADILPADESKEKEGSYVTVTVLNDQEEKMKKLKSKVMKGTLQPTFSDCLEFEMSDNLLPDISLVVALKAKRLLKKNILLGTGELKSDSEYWKKLLEDGIVTVVIPVFNKPKIDKE